MSKYPEEITADVLAKHAHISDDDVRRDIDDTEAEIRTYERLYPAGVGNISVTERQDFVAFLTRLLNARAAVPTPV